MKVRKELIHSELSKFNTACSVTNSTSILGIKQIVAFYSSFGELLFVESGKAFLSCGASVESLYFALPFKVRQQVAFACVYYRSSSAPFHLFEGSFCLCEVGKFRAFSLLVPSYFYDREHYFWSLKTFWELGQIQVSLNNQNSK